MTPHVAAIHEQRDRQPVYLRCDCCNTPIAEVRGPVLVMIDRHDGQKHTSIWTPQRLREIAALLERAA